MKVKKSLVGNEISRVAPRVLINDIVLVLLISDAVISLSLAAEFARWQVIVRGIKPYAIPDKDQRQKHLLFTCLIAKVGIAIRVRRLLREINAFAVHSRSREAHVETTLRLVDQAGLNIACAMKQVLHDLIDGIILVLFEHQFEFDEEFFVQNAIENLFDRDNLIKAGRYTGE